MFIVERVIKNAAGLYSRTRRGVGSSILKIDCAMSKAVDSFCRRVHRSGLFCRNYGVQVSGAGFESFQKEKKKGRVSNKLRRF